MLNNNKYIYLQFNSIYAGTQINCSLNANLTCTYDAWHAYDMVTIIIHIAYIICLATNDAWHAYDVIGVYMIHHEAGRISYFKEPQILWLAGTVMGEVGDRNI